MGSLWLLEYRPAEPRSGRALSSSGVLISMHSKQNSGEIVRIPPDVALRTINEDVTSFGRNTEDKLLSQLAEGKLNREAA